MRDKKREIESIIAKAGLTEQEKKVARVYYGSKSAGTRTRYFVAHLSLRKYGQLLESAQKKIEPFLTEKGASK